MSEVIERVAEAIDNAPEAWCRTNKTRDDGRVYEVGYTDPGGLISDETLHVVEAFASYRDAKFRLERLTSDLRARAAIASMREPTETMVDVGRRARWASSVRDANNVREIWTAMNDMALK